MSANRYWRAKAGTNFSFGWNKATRSPLVVAIPSASTYPNTALSYVANWGNDLTGDGSPDFPFATPAKGGATSSTVILGSGKWYSISVALNKTFIGDGDVEIINEVFPTIDFTPRCSAYNIKWVNYNSINNNGGPSASGSLIGCTFVDTGINGSAGISFVQLFQHSIFIAKTRALACNMSNVTSRYSTIVVGANSTLNSTASLRDKIIYALTGIKIIIATISSAAYRNIVFIGNLYDIGATTPISIDLSNTTLYPDQTAEGRIRYLRLACVTKFGGIESDHLFACKCIASPTLEGIGGTAITVFNNPSQDNYTISDVAPDYVKFGGELQLTVGPGEQTKRISIADFPNASGYRYNMTQFTGPDRLEPTDLNDSTGLCAAKSKIIDRVKVRDIVRVSIEGSEAFRNGQDFGAVTDLDKTQITAPGTLENKAVYIVFGDSIIYPAGSSVPTDTYTPGQKVAATTAKGTTFTALGSASYLRKVTQYPSRESILYRFSDGRVLINQAIAAQMKFWYYVQSGSPQFNQPCQNNDGAVIPPDTPIAAGTIFRTPTTLFTQAGNWTMREIFSDDAPFLLMETGIRMSIQGTTTKVGTADLDSTYNGVSNPVSSIPGINATAYDYTSSSDPIKARFEQVIVKGSLDNQKFS